MCWAEIKGLWNLQYIPRNMHTVFALLCFVVVIHWLVFPYPSGLLHWHCGNLTIAPVPAKPPWWIWINTSCEFIMNDCVTTTKQSTTTPCAYFLGYTVYCLCLAEIKGLWNLFCCILLLNLLSLIIVLLFILLCLTSSPLLIINDCHYHHFRFCISDATFQLLFTSIIYHMEILELLVCNKKWLAWSTRWTCLTLVYNIYFLCRIRRERNSLWVPSWRKPQRNVTSRNHLDIRYTDKRRHEISAFHTTWTGDTQRSEIQEQ